MICCKVRAIVDATHSYYLPTVRRQVFADFQEHVPVCVSMLVCMRVPHMFGCVCVCCACACFLVCAFVLERRWCGIACVKSRVRSFRK